jgi:hypothetical protein
MTFKKNEPARLRFGAWSHLELAELARLREAFPPPVYESENGISEEGDPWWVITEASSERVLIHVTRIGHRYSVANSDEQILKTTIEIKAAIELAIAAVRARR